ncbi:helix-turn-helix domain-containing protein [Bacillus cereus]|nr:helix-turn-helix domain-containing protein [Bacillus cereus]
MNGLEYILGLYNMQHLELAEKLGIKKQNINLWIKGRQNIPKKYLPILEETFGLSASYFIKELSEVDKLEIQKEKLKRELKPIIKSYGTQFMVEKQDLVNVPIYDKKEMNRMERSIEKAKLIDRFKCALEIVEDSPYLDTFKLIVELMEKVQHEAVLHKTIEALAHYYEVLPDWVNSEPEQEEFEQEIFEVFDDHNY